MNEKYVCEVEVWEPVKPGSRSAEIQPQGFWSSDFISVHQSSGYGEMKWQPPSINWGCGGSDNSLSKIEQTESFIEGLKKAIEIAKKWDADTGKPISNET